MAARTQKAAEEQTAQDAVLAEADAAEATTTDENTNDDAPAEAGDTTAALKNKLRNQAERMVIKRHRDEYDAIAKELFAENGIEYAPRLTDEQKAEQKLLKLLEASPELAAKYGVQAPAAAE